MSYATLKIVDADGDVVDHSEYRNAFGFGPRVWDALVKRYKAKLPDIINPFDLWTALWKAVTDKVIDLQPWEWNTLVSTYDNVMVRADDLVVLAGSFETFESKYPAGQFVSHLKAMAAIFRELSGAGGAPGGVCFYGTSVIEDPWSVSERTVAGAEPDDDEYEDRPYNVSSDEKHWYAELRR